MVANAPPAPGPRRRCAVVVLGDFGRSPRMNYHALSLANQANMEVDVVAFKGSNSHERIRSHEHIHMKPLPNPPVWPVGLPRIIGLPIKALVQVFQLMWVLLVVIKRPHFILMQNPPSIPSLLCCQVACFLRRAKLVVDWHNYAYTLLGMVDTGRGRAKPAGLGGGQVDGGGVLVGVARWYEMRFGQYAHGHLCVTKAMQRDLKARWKVDASVMYDCPPDYFSATPPSKAHVLMLRIADELAKPLHMHGDCCAGTVKVEEDEREATLMTCLTKEGVTMMRPDRPALLVTSTSWTPDEDIGMLIDALTQFDQMTWHHPDEFPRLLVCITGKGPQRRLFETQLMVTPFRRVSVRTLWLSAEDYPVLLGMADLGVSLHTSSSGLDLPMKVVDMFGCGLPVLSASYRCIDELVKHGENGMLFRTAEELCAHFRTLFRKWPEGNVKLEQLKDGVTSAKRVSWEESWAKGALPVFAPAENGS